jgi:radical SAM protein with 4Fe4S-binding SPASM domain
MYDFKKVGSVGNIKDELFSELWEKVKIKNEAMKMKHEKCMHCNIDLLLFNSFKR